MQYMNSKSPVMNRTLYNLMVKTVTTFLILGQSLHSDEIWTQSEISELSYTLNFLANLWLYCRETFTSITSFIKNDFTFHMSHVHILPK